MRTIDLKWAADGLAFDLWRLQDRGASVQEQLAFIQRWTAQQEKSVNLYLRLNAGSRGWNPNFKKQVVKQPDFVIDEAE